MNHLLLIGGKPRSGKTTFAEVMQSFGAHSLNLSDILISDLSRRLGIDSNYFLENKSEARPVLQWAGEVYYKQLIGTATYFVERAMRENFSHKYLVITGVRRKAEIDYLKSVATRNLIPLSTLYIRRKQLGDTDPAFLHPVENELTEEDFESTFDNSGDLTALRAQARRYWERISGQD